MEPSYQPPQATHIFESKIPEIFPDSPTGSSPSLTSASDASQAKISDIMTPGKNQAAQLRRSSNQSNIKSTPQASVWTKATLNNSPAHQMGGAVMVKGALAQGFGSISRKDGKRELATLSPGIKNPEGNRYTNKVTLPNGKTHTLTVILPGNMAKNEINKMFATLATKMNIPGEKSGFLTENGLADVHLSEEEAFSDDLEALIEEVASEATAPHLSPASSPTSAVRPKFSEKMQERAKLNAEKAATPNSSSQAAPPRPKTDAPSLGKVFSAQDSASVPNGVPLKPATTKSNNDSNPFIATLGGRKPLATFMKSADPVIQNLASSAAKFMTSLGATSGNTKPFGLKTSAGKVNLPVIDLKQLKDDQSYAVMTDGKTTVSLTGKEIKEMAQSAKAWTAGKRSKTFKDPGLATGLVTSIEQNKGKKSNTREMMQVMTFSQAPRPMVDVQGNIVPRKADDPGHFVCNASAPDLTDPEIKKMFLKGDALDIKKIKAEFLEPMINDYVSECIDNGVEQITLSAIGLGAFGAKLSTEQKKEYAQTIVELTAKAIEKNRKSEITHVVFSGEQFKEVELPKSSVSFIQTDNEVTNCELAAGDAGMRSAALYAGDQNKLPGCLAVQGVVKKINDSEEPFKAHVAQDEASFLRNPILAFLQSGFYNPGIANRK